MVKIITFEGVDYSGKTTTLLYLAKQFSKKEKLAFNEGPIYPNSLTARLLTIANQANELEREFLYTMVFALDTTESLCSYSQDERVFFQDRYWPSVIAYGRFLNGINSIHNHQDFRSLFISPVATIHFSCSYEEKNKRSIQRGRKSVLDRFLLDNHGEFERLEEEIKKSLEGLPNIFRIDTTEKSVQEVAFEIENYADTLKLLS